MGAMKNCPAVGCREKIPEGIVFCAHHWSRLPPDLKKKLLKTFPLGAIVLQQKPGQDYTEYLRQAVGCLEVMEKRR
jgi:hypothetical protein